MVGFLFGLGFGSSVGCGIIVGFKFGSWIGSFCNVVQGLVIEYPLC